MKRKSFYTIIAALIAFTSNVWADTNKLTAEDGWTKITTLPTASDIANNYYVFVDATRDLMLGIGKGVHQDTKWYSLGVFYCTSVGPTSKDITPMVWTLEAQDTYFAMRNLDQPVRLFMTEWNAAWKFDTNDIFNVSNDGWTKVQFVYSDEVWSLQNGYYPSSGYIGPWDNVIENGAECAANKTDGNVGKFHIYAISRAQFKQNLLDNASDSNPVDLTPWYVTNATLDQNADGWTSSFTANSSSWWGSHAFSNTGAENYQQVGNFYQALTVPNGKYKVAMQGATSKPEENEPYVYGIHNGVKTKTYFTQSTQTSPDGSKWNDMQYTLLQMMSNRAWGQVITDEITVTTNALTIGYANEGGWSWDVFDNFKLYCTGIDLSAYEIQLSDLVNECNDFIDEGLVPDACETIIADAITDYNKEYETAKEYSSAILALTAVLDTYRNDADLQAAYATYKTMRTNVQGLADNNTYKYTDSGTAKSTFDGAISTANSAVEAATTASAINAQATNIRAAAMTFISSVTAEDGNPFNLTFLASTAAADWQTASGLNPAATAPAWSVPKPDPSMADFVESYTEASGGESITGNILYQTINDMPAGYYTVALYAAASYTPNRGSLVEKCTDGQPNITFGFAGDNSLSLPVAHRTSLTAADQVPVNLSVQLSDAGALTFGIKKTAAGSNWHVAQIYTITYSKDPDLTILKADRDALVSEAEGVLASADASLLTTEQQDALSSAISTANAANTFDDLTEVTMTTLPNAIQTARQQIQTVKDNRVLMIAALERFENDYNLADGTDYRRSTMSAAAWTDLLAKVNAVSTALDDVSQAANYGTLKDNLVNQMDATDASLRLFKSYKAMVDGATALSIAGDYGADSNMDTDDTQQTAISALNENFDNYAATQSSNFDVSAFLGANLDFSAAEGPALNTENSNNIHKVTGWEVSYADADTWAVIQTHQEDNNGKLYMRKNWGSSATTMTVTKQKMLPVGKYRLSLSWNSDMANMTNSSAYKIAEASTAIGETTDGAKTLTYDFEITDAATPFDLTFGFQKTGTGNTPAQIVFDDITLTYTPNIILYDKGNDAENNSTTIASNNGKRGVVTLSGRTLYKDNSWNTICLPFSITADQVTVQLAPTALMELDTDAGSYDHITGLDGTTLYLNFKDATAIEAGKPYLIKWASGDDIVNPTFTGVTISNDTPEGIASTDGSVTFQGIYTPTPLDKDDKSNLYLAADNTLDWPNVDDFKVNAFRAYFKISESAANNVRSFVLRFGNDDITSINIEKGVNGVVGDGFYYTINGQRLNGKPTTSGVYIYNGKKVVIE